MSDRSAPTLERLLFIADAAVGEVGELPPPVRAIIGAAAELEVLTPVLPGRLAWLADDVDGFRRAADARLESVLTHMKVIARQADGRPRRGSAMTVIADAIAAFQPDHILMALRSHEHPNWQERHLVERIEARFALPVVTYTVDPEGHATTGNGPLLLCYDGSADAAHAIRVAGALFGEHPALVATVWQPTIGVNGPDWSYSSDSAVDYGALDDAARDASGRTAHDGVRIARAAGFDAHPVHAKAGGDISTKLVEIAEDHDAALVVMGSRGLVGLQATLYGSASSGVLHHLDRPTLIVRDSKWPTRP
jgi:nucleotide-binding universal stress UspA family protein